MELSDYFQFTPRYLRVTRALTFGFLTWMPVHCLMKVWQMLSYTTASQGFPSNPRGWEAIFYSAPDSDYFVIAIAIGAGLVTMVWMLSRGTVPGGEALGLTAVFSLAVSACLYQYSVRLWESYLFSPWGFSKDIVQPLTISILILDVEAAVIASLLWKWRRHWLLNQKSAPIAGDLPVVGTRAATTASIRPFGAPDCAVFLFVVIGTVSLLAYGGWWLATPPEARGDANHRAICERRLQYTGKDRPRQWIVAARDVARARAAETPEAGVAELWQEIIELEEAVDGKDSVDAISDTFFLADFLLKYRRPAEAEKWLRRYIDACARRNGEDHPFLDSARSKLATALRDQGKQNESK